MKYIAFDSHKRYTFASVEDQESGEVTDKMSINTQIPAVNLHPLSRRCTHSLSTALE